MPELRELQRAFAAYVLEPGPRAVPPQVRGGALGPAECLNIHRNNTFVTLREALAAVYPVVCQLVGEAFFTDLARGFVRRHPCRSGNLHDFGRELEAWLAAEERLCALPYLSDVARLEWAMHAALHGPDAVTLDLNRLRDVPTARLPSLHFVLAPGCSLMQSQYPVLSIWQAHQGGGPVPRIDLDTGPERVLISRQRLEVALRPLGVAEYVFLCAVGGGDSLECATEAALDVDDDFDLKPLLGHYVASGVFTDVRIQSDPVPVSRGR